jgi:asparagine synthase (glutamine-hydrolysing)
MCGIVGIIGKDTQNKHDIVRLMSDTIRHRGPDDDGFFDDEHVSLGMRRLSIIDLKTGKQPITSADGNSMIFFNGEIYNYRELRVELEKKGYVFKTDSDTETILHLYEAYGKAGLSKLRGMFTFCIYDSATHVLFLARDMFGIKPLYYLKLNNQVLGFASEIKSLLEHPKYVREVNDQAVFQYLRFQYNPLEETFFKNIFTLRPGNCMTIDLLADTFEIEEYYKFGFDIDQNLTEDKTATKTRDVMKDSVAHHMISHVPVGSFLSGGVDSSIIATLMNEVISEEKPGTKNKTFTVGFKELSEGTEARETSDMLGTDHTEIKVSKEDYFKVLPRLVWHFDEPVADPSAIALYFVAREARKKVTVVLSGEGADELFGGYNIYLAPIAARKIAWIPHVLLKLAADYFPPMWGKNYLKRVSGKLSDWYIGIQYFDGSVFTEKQRNELWKSSKPSDNSIPFLKKAYEQAAAEHISDSATMQLVDINTWLVGDILAKADKMTMANSLELRVPFLDREVANLAKTLPDRLKWKDGQTKHVLRKAFEYVIPEAARNRRKLGFPTPLKVWLDKDAIVIYDTIRNSSYIKSHLDMKIVEEVVGQQAAEERDNTRKVYLLYMLALWYQVFFEEK